MRFLLDACVATRSLVEFLVALGHDVLSTSAIDPHATDEHILEIALRDDRILITADKDFGELVFVQHLPHGPLVRIVDLPVDEQVQATGELLQNHRHDLTGPVVITVARGRIRVRRPNQELFTQTSERRSPYGVAPVSTTPFKFASPCSKSPPTILSTSMIKWNALPTKLFSPVMLHVTNV